jgi:hypothetical protein
MDVESPFKKVVKKDNIDSVSSGFDTPDEYDNDITNKDGIYPPLANLQYALHAVLSDKGEEEKIFADQILKGNANKKLRESLKLERVKSAQIFAKLFDPDSTVSNGDVPHFQPFNERKLPCPPEEFDRQFKGIVRNFPQFEGRCVEFLYFLIELEALRSTFNITDEQLLRILQNRLSGRFRQYFMNEIRREKNVVQVLNDLGPKYAETIDVSAEVEKCAKFKFGFQNIGKELIELKETMSLAYPHLPTEIFREVYIQKIIDTLPSKIRFEAVEMFQQHTAKETFGFKPLEDHEINKKIINLCKTLREK